MIREKDEMSHKKIAQQFKSETRHRYSVGDKVTLTIEAVISEHMPFTFIDPAYIVKVGKVELAVSERSLKKVEGGDDDGSES